MKNLDIGIFRKIPLINNVKRIDGTTSKNRAKITNISVSENYTTYKENGYEVIKIGDISESVIGKHTYTIRYTYNIGKDPLKDVDELYYNLIGNEWDANIGDVKFKVTMPKTFDKSLLGFSSGYEGSTNNIDVQYNVDGNVISGYLTDVLRAGEAFTIRLTLPEGYFVGASSNIDIYSIVVIIICLICILIADRLWFKYGKDNEVIETVEFYPPEGYNSAEVGLLYKGSANTQSIISLLIYLANKGYLRIEETQEKGKFLGSKNFRITKIKEYDGNNENEREFFEGLFEKKYNIDEKKVREIMKEAKKNGKKITYTEATTLVENDMPEKTSVTMDDLYNNFYTTLNWIENKLNSKENKSKIFESIATGKIKWIILMIIAIFILITFKPVVEYAGIQEAIIAVIFIGVEFSILPQIVFSKFKMILKILIMLWYAYFLWVPLNSMVFPALAVNTMYLVTYIVGIISMAVLALFKKIMPKRTPFGTEMLGKLKGFKRFLETAEKPQLESLVTQNPEYFYNILPYTYALGVSDVWIKQFETIAIQAPTWYYSTNDFNMREFGYFMDNTMSVAKTAMSSSPSSDGGSGGGFSGGGSGGGGGGSW